MSGLKDFGMMEQSSDVVRWMSKFWYVEIIAVRQL